LQHGYVKFLSIFKEGVDLLMCCKKAGFIADMVEEGKTWGFVGFDENIPAVLNGM
jgi:hypothetical protein